MDGSKANNRDRWLWESREAEFRVEYGSSLDSDRGPELRRSNGLQVRADFNKESNMRKTDNWIASMTVAVAMLGVSALLSLPARADTAAAEATFKSKCAMCHGPDGKGETATGKAMKAGDFASADVQKMSDADLTDAITKGKGKMPAYKTLTPDQVKDLVAYVRAFGKKK
jgi:mono/diheme cytochrome c family protein